MNPWLFLTLVLLAIALALWIPHWRLKRALQAPFPREWERVLERNVEVYQKLPPPLVMALPRLTGQKEVRYVQLLGGSPDLAEIEAQAARHSTEDVGGAGLDGRVDALEAALESLQEEIAELRARLGPAAD